MIAGKPNFKKEMIRYEQSNLLSSIRQMLNSIIPFFALWYAAYLCMSISYWITVLLSMAASGFVIRIFIIFHDCCHQSFFKNRSANHILGTVTGILTFFSYSKWRHNHSIHHATSSNLDKRGTGDVWILTVEEYVAASVWRRMVYRLYRNPLIMFGIGPVYMLLIQNRMNRRNARRKERFNTYLTNIAIAVLAAWLCWGIGWQAFLLIQGTILFVSGAAGIWLFYVQHQFEDSYFEPEADWDYVKAAVEGSSYYKLPKILQWLTGNIGYHHIHHLSPRIPNYKLEQAHDLSPALHKVSTISIVSSLKSIRFRLWDEQNKRFVGFRDIKHLLVYAKYGVRIIYE
ncbi:MAG: fatty acid desaturase family protein [Paenibacillus sp.]|nr:fatty acid desaturase family protein [Paenibacillus sp.]